MCEYARHRSLYCVSAAFISIVVHKPVAATFLNDDTVLTESVWPCRVVTSDPSSNHSLPVVSQLPDSTMVLSTNTALVTAPVCPLSSTQLRKSRVGHTFSLKSFDPEETSVNKTAL